MDSKNGGCCKLPDEVIERVLSFLPVPDLCRMRSVCKTWSELMSRPSFHDLCDLNGPSNVYLFVWRHHSRRKRGAFEPSSTGTLSFLDVDARRWYSIQVTELPRVSAGGMEIETRLMAVDDGLVMELNTSRFTGNNLALALSDPVAKTRRMLPALPQFYSTGGPLPLLVTAVDPVTGSYKVFLLNNLCQEIVGHETLPRVWVHKSFTNEWQEQRIPPATTAYGGLWAFSAVALHQTVYLSKRILDDFEFDEVRLLCYKPQEDTWAEVWRMSFPRYIEEERLVVSGNRLFLILWTLVHPRSRYNPLLEDRDCPNFESLFQTNQDYPETLFEMYEVLVAENGRKPVVQLTDAQLQQILGTDYIPSYDVACGFPCFHSNGICNSIALVRKSTGQIRRYYLATGSVDVFPPHPLVPTSEELASVVMHDTGSPRFFVYDAKTTKLSLRNVLLAQPQKTGTSSAG